jgi:hypothetical protein
MDSTSSDWQIEVVRGLHIFAVPLAIALIAWIVIALDERERRKQRNRDRVA